MPKRSSKMINKFKAQSKGSRNLVLLGLMSTLIAVTTTSVALAIYHNSGDIYLDRSRPGYLPDEEEIKDGEDDEEEQEYEFSKSGVIKEADLTEFLEHLGEEIKEIDEYKKPFSSEVLSDTNLGITMEEAKTEEQPVEEQPVEEQVNTEQVAP